MAYFNHAFKKTMLMNEYVPVTVDDDTSTLTSGQVALYNAQTFTGINPAAGDCDPCPLQSNFIVNSISYHD